MFLNNLFINSLKSSNNSQNVFVPLKQRIIAFITTNELSVVGSEVIITLCYYIIANDKNIFHSFRLIQFRLLDNQSKENDAI